MPLRPPLSLCSVAGRVTSSVSFLLLSGSMRTQCASHGSGLNCQQLCGMLVVPGLLWWKPRRERCCNWPQVTWQSQGLDRKLHQQNPSRFVAGQVSGCVPDSRFLLATVSATECSFLKGSIHGTVCCCGQHFSLESVFHVIVMLSKQVTLMRLLDERLDDVGPSLLGVADRQGVAGCGDPPCCAGTLVHQRRSSQLMSPLLFPKAVGLWVRC